MIYYFKWHYQGAVKRQQGRVVVGAGDYIHALLYARRQVRDQKLIGVPLDQITLKDWNKWDLTDWWRNMAIILLYVIIFILAYFLVAH